MHPSIVWSMVALKCLGYPDNSGEVQYCHRQLQDSGFGRRGVRHDQAPAVQVARLGYRDDGPGVGGQRPAARSFGHPAGHRVVAGTADHAARRLGGNSRRRAGRMVLAICQRLLPRLRRYGDGAAGAEDAVFRRAGGSRGPAARVAAGPRQLPRREEKTGKKSRRSRTRCRPSTGASAGCWPCKIATADGRHSTGTTVGSSSAMPPSPTITP